MPRTTTVNLAMLQRSPLTVFQHLASQQPDVYCLSKRHPAAFIVTDPELVRQVLKGDDGAIIKGAMPENVRPVLGDGTAASWFPPEPPPETTSSPNLDSIRDERRDIVFKFLQASATSSARNIARLSAHFSHSQSDGAGIDVYAAMHELMFCIAMECIFKITLTEELLTANRAIRKSAPILHQHLRSYRELYAPYFDRIYAPRFELWHWLPGSHFDTLRARRRAVDDIADFVMGNGDPSPAGRNIPDSAAVDLLDHIPSQTAHQRRSTLVGLLLASYENAACACAWAIWCLAAHIGWQDRVADEIKKLSVEFAEFDSFRSHCPLLTATLYETLRLYPPVWSIGRVAKQLIRLDNHELPSGSSIIISPWLQHRHPELWEDSECFQPERFCSISGRRSEGAFLPFGAKPHACPGERFSWFTIATVLAEMLKLWRFVSVENNTPQPMLGLTQRPANGIMIRLTSRK